MKSTGELIGYPDYEPFGAPLSAKQEKTRLGFIDKEQDKESSLADHGVRKYDYETGRFMSCDALWGKYINLNPYQYSGNDPLSKMDYNGLLATSDHKKVERQSYQAAGRYLGITFNESYVNNMVVANAAVDGHNLPSDSWMHFMISDQERNSLGRFKATILTKARIDQYVRENPNDLAFQHHCIAQDGNTDQHFDRDNDLCFEWGTDLVTLIWHLTEGGGVTLQRTINATVNMIINEYNTGKIPSDAYTGNPDPNEHEIANQLPDNVV